MTPPCNGKTQPIDELAPQRQVSGGRDALARHESRAAPGQAIRESISPVSEARGLGANDEVRVDGLELESPVRPCCFDQLLERLCADDHHVGSATVGRMK